MAIYADTIGALVLNLSLFGTGLALAIVALVLGATRGMTQEKSMWGITFASLAWAVALIIPNLPFSIIVFLAGAFAIVNAFTPLLNDVRGSHIAVIAIIAGLINLTMLLGSGAYYDSVNWLYDPASAITDINSELGVQETAFGNIADGDSSGLCNPDEEGCSDTVTQGSYNPLNFDPIASLLAMGDYIIKIVKFAGMVLTAPIIIERTIQDRIINPVISLLIAVFITLWNFAILFKTAMFILNRRGQP